MAQRLQIRAVVTDLKFVDEVLLELLTVSLLEPGFNTRAAREAKDLLLQDDLRYLATRVASAVWRDSTECASHLARARAEAARALALAREAGATIVTILDARYPEVLKEIADPPVVLWVLGRPDSLASVSVGVVGSRDATPASLALAFKLGRELSEAGVTVVSGLARGVDGAAHAGALEGPAPTIAVLGSGVSVIYPKRHEPLAQRIQERGAIVSELPPWFPPYRQHFPLRNRIISGLSEGVVVIEASEESGSLITAHAAEDQNRDVMAVPGPPLSGRHRGSNGLIKDGARLVETVDDILEEIGWHSMPQKVQNAGNRLQLNYLEETMAVGESYSVDFLATRTGRIVTDLLPDLAELELSGRITRLTGGHFMRLPERG